MRRLMLLRHAKTETDAPSGHDQDRRLDDRGRMDAAVIGRWIGQHPGLRDSFQFESALVFFGNLPRPGRRHARILRRDLSNKSPDRAVTTPS